MFTHTHTHTQGSDVETRFQYQFTHALICTYCMQMSAEWSVVVEYGSPPETPVATHARREATRPKSMQCRVARTNQQSWHADRAGNESAYKIRKKYIVMRWPSSTPKNIWQQTT